MKILTLRLCNLAAFAGEHELDFTRSPLSECGLFAITGPTGSGKSTLLDAMCLALFGSTPRLRQMPGAGTLPQDDSVQLRDPRTLLRRGCTYALAEVTFIGVDQQRYAASWSVRRARNAATGKIQNSTQVLRRLDPEEQVLTDGKQDFNRKLPEVLGLSFDQFTRAVLLAQAEFSAFLKANDNERSALLERLTDSDIYSRLSRSAYQKHRAIKQQHADFASHLEQTRPCDESQRNQLNAEVTQAHTLLEEHRHTLATLEEQHRQLTRQHALVSDYHTQQQQFTALDEQWQQSDSQREQCAALDRFAPLRDILFEWQSHQQRHNALKEDYQRHTLAVDTTTEAVYESETLWSKARRHRETLESQQRQTAPQLESALALEERHQHIASRQQEVTTALNALEQQHHAHCAQLAQIDETHRDDRAMLTALRQQQSSLTALPAPQRLESLHQRISCLDQLRQRWDQRLTHTQSITTYRQQFNDYRAEQQRAETLCADRQQHLQLTQQALTQAAQHRQQLHDALLAYSEQTLSALRQLLSDAAPCPVCGSTEHNAVASPPTILIDTQRAVAQQQLRPAEDALATAQQQHEEAQHQWHIAELALTKAKALSEQASHTLTQQLSTDTPLFSLERCQHRISALHQRIERTRQHYQTLTQCTTRIHTLESALQEAELQRQRIEGAQQHNASQRQAHQQQRDELNQQHKALQATLAQQLGAHPSAHAWKKFQEAALQQARQQEQATLEQLEHCRLKQQHAQKAQQEHHVQWVTHCSRVKSLSSQIEEWRASQPAPWQSDEAMAHLQAITIADHLALKNALSSLESARHDADICQRTYRHQCHTQLDEAQQAQLETPDTLLATLAIQIATLKERQQDQQTRVDTAQRAYETARARQLEDDQRRQRYAELVDQRQQAEQELERWGKISGLIGSADGALFRKMAQQWHLDVLIVHANRHLQTLARRFSLKRGGSELGLMIVDRDMGDEERSVHSLSGGETFLVSLALALGLAAMASDRLLIGTLFIDEGFGSLDTRARAMAMDALEALQAQGRQVGIISHVQELHERIPVQVQVCPGGREGSSHLKITSPRSLLDLN